MSKGIDVKYKVLLQGLDCANCASKIEIRINELPQVKECSVDFINSSCVYTTDNNEVVIDEIKKIVSEIEPDVKVIEEETMEHNEFKYKKIQMFIGFVLIVFGAWLRTYNSTIGNSLFVISYMLLGYKVIIKAVKNLLKGNLFDENFLMSLATTVAIFLGEYLEASAVMIFYQFGELFQDQAVASSKKSITSLMNIRPDYANVIRKDKAITINPSLVNIDEIIVVKPGERVPLDGVIIEGSSTLDTSSLTGESLGKYVGIDSVVNSGCVNIDGLLKVMVTKSYDESTVNKIIELVENTSSRKSKPEKFITKFAKFYTPIVVISAVLIAVILPLIINITYGESIRRASIFLIISCPCALVLSIPLGFYAGIGGLSKLGILVKGSTIIETLSKVSAVVFDKTGTLTEGKFYVEKVSDEDVKRLGAYAEYNSNHPIAKSIVQSYENEIDSSLITDFKEYAGYGVEATLSEGKVLVGNVKLMKDNNIDIPKINEIGAIVYVSLNNIYKGYLTIKDRIKKDSVCAIKNLIDSGINNISMVTGDNESVAREVGETLNIFNVYAGKLPDEKVEIIKNLLQDNTVIFVGDGINDAPVLAMSDVGIAMGGLGSDAAIEASDVVIMDDNPSKVALAIKQSKKTMNIIVLNILFAIGIKIIVLISGALGFSSMWLAIFADVGVSIICILNSIRLLNVNKI